jgi:hypothetical protein
MHTHTYIYIYIYTHIYSYIYKHTHIHIHICSTILDYIGHHKAVTAVSLNDVSL